MRRGRNGFSELTIFSEIDERLFIDIGSELRTELVEKVKSNLIC